MTKVEVVVKRHSKEYRAKEKAEEKAEEKRLLEGIKIVKYTQKECREGQRVILDEVYNFISEWCRVYDFGVKRNTISVKGKTVDEWLYSNPVYMKNKYRSRLEVTVKDERNKILKLFLEFHNVIEVRNSRRKLTTTYYGTRHSYREYGSKCSKLYCSVIVKCYNEDFFGIARKLTRDLRIHLEEQYSVEKALVECYGFEPEEE